MRRFIPTLLATLLLAAFALPAFAQQGGPNCDELASIADLQAAIEEYGAEDYDADGDGFACEEDFNYQYTTAGTPQPSTPAPGITTPSRIDAGAGGAATFVIN